MIERNDWKWCKIRNGPERSKATEGAKGIATPNGKMPLTPVADTLHALIEDDCAASHEGAAGGCSAARAHSCATIGSFRCIDIVG